MTQSQATYVNVSQGSPDPCVRLVRRNETVKI